MRITKVLALVAVVAAIAVPAAMAMAFEEGYNPPDAQVGTPYSFTFHVYGGCPPYNLVVISGALPAGLTLSSSGTISGTPTAAGQAGFWVELRDTGCGPSATCPPAGISCSSPSQRPFTINVIAKLTVTTASLDHATVGTPYSVKLTADGGGSQTWSVSAGTLPAGLALAPDGTLSGTPTADTPTPAQFTVKVTDGSRTDTKALQLDVVKPLTLTVPTLSIGEVGHDLRPAKATATGGREAYAWSLVGAPSWLAIDPASGALTGSPDAAGTFRFQVSVKDTYGTVATANGVAAVKNKVAVKTTKLPATKVGRPYRWLLRAAGGVAPLTWKATSGKFPVGIRLDRKTGVLSGTARQAGLYPLTFTVTDSYGETSDVSLKLNVLPKKKKK